MNSYKDLSLYDRESVKANYQFGLWNKVGRECQQVCEKYMKYYLQENHLLTEELARTHNLKKLFKALPKREIHLYKDLSVIGDYYFEVNYPGDNFIELDEEMADEAIAVTDELLKFVDLLVKEGNHAAEN